MGNWGEGKHPNSWASKNHKPENTHVSQLGTIHTTSLWEKSIRRWGCWLETGLSLTNTVCAKTEMQSQHLRFLLDGRTGCLEAVTVLLQPPNLSHGCIYALGGKLPFKRKKKKTSLNFAMFFNLSYCIAQYQYLRPCTSTHQMHVASRNQQGWGGVCVCVRSLN